MISKIDLLEKERHWIVWTAHDLENYTKNGLGGYMHLQPTDVHAGTEKLLEKDQRSPGSA